jgi:DtxR family manganese transport transcriptional regulator
MVSRAANEYRAKKTRAGQGCAKVKVAASPEPHKMTRQAHASELAEDYVEVINDLFDERGEARVVEIAKRLGVSHVTVNRTVARLARQGLVTAERYRSIFLTSEGMRLASKVRRRHVVVLEFLERIGVDQATARIDAEGIEHHVSDKTLKALERFCRQSSIRKKKAG